MKRVWLMIPVSAMASPGVVAGQERFERDIIKTPEGDLEIITSKASTLPSCP